MIEVAVRIFSILLRLIPDRMPGKGRIGRLLLSPFKSSRSVVLQDRNGYIYRLPSYCEPIAAEIFAFGAYERDTQRFILKRLPEVGVFVDVGANIGALAIPIAKSRPLSSIICVEADPKLHQILIDNITHNNCSKAQIISCAAGASDAQQIAFYPAPDGKFGMGSIGPQFGQPISVMQRTLDGILAELDINHVDVLKIDVEGAECGVLQGCRRLLASQRPPVVVFEFADWAEARIPEQQTGDAQALLMAQGFRIFHLTKGELGAELNEPLRKGFAMLVAIPSNVDSQVLGSAGQ